MNKDKEKVLEDFINMIKDSWTYARLTKEEKENFIDHLSWQRTKHILKGTYKQRWETLNELYWFYLLGIGYKDFNWRESERENAMF
jgi:hypothetical protein